MESTLFPYDAVRKEQDKLVATILSTIKNKGQLVVHAPTGLGKTVASLAPAIELAIAEKKIVVFMTSRLTQHKLALETVSKIRQRHNIKIPVVDLIGKQHLCLQPGVATLKGKEFADYCKAMREDELCEYYTRIKTGEKLSPTTNAVLVQLANTSPNSPEQVKMVCGEDEHKLCPYEIQMLQAKDAMVIITDYSYLFNPRIREGFFNRINKSLEDCILIVDEGHNLPSRVKDLASERVSSLTLKRAIRELEKYNPDSLHYVKQLQELFLRLVKNTEEEKYITREEFLQGVQKIEALPIISSALQKVAVIVREEQKASSCGVLADFLDAWTDQREGFTRIISVQRQKRPEQPLHPLFGKQDNSIVTVSYRCLDPSLVTKPVFDRAHSTIFMSGTLTPVEMYGELLGFSNPTLLTLNSPFPSSNRLNLIIPKTTTKFTARSEAMYQEIADVCSQVTEAVPGNVAIFFPSYRVMQDVQTFFQVKTSKTVFTENTELSKQEREELLERFKEYKHTGAVLLGVMGGSFSEGIDLPGKELSTVIIVGLPLGRPDLETKALIDYYQEKFGKGWEYGYTFPAFNRTLQSAGRCIRTEEDRGVIVFLDERYAWQNYHKCFPKEWHIKVTLLYKRLLEEFFHGQKEI